MANTIVLPKLGQTMEEGTIVEWLKKEGDPVSRGDILFQVESDKAVLEVESRYKGVLLKILVGPNVKVPVLTPVGIIGEPGESVSSPEATSAAEPSEAGSGQPTPQVEVAGEPGALTAETPGARVLASPRARRLAREERIDITLLAGSGQEGASSSVMLRATWPAAPPRRPWPST